MLVKVFIYLSLVNCTVVYSLIHAMLTPDVRCYGRRLFNFYMPARFACCDILPVFCLLHCRAVLAMTHTHGTFHSFTHTQR